MKRIAIIGTGIMGNGMAENFLKHGYSVTVWNRSKDKLHKLTSEGASVAESPKEAAMQADVVFEVTANDESSRSVWCSDDGILAGARRGATLITSATLSPAWISDLAKKCAEQKLSFFDMPLTGGRIAAESGQLTLLVGGNEEELESLRPTLQAIAANIKYFGQIGSGTKYKLVLNTLQAIHIIGFGEALKLANSVGLDEQIVGEALVERPGGIITQIAWNSKQQQPNPITFSIDWITKDLSYAAEMSNKVEHQLLNKVLEQYKKIAKDHGQEDWTKINDL